MSTMLRVWYRHEVGALAIVLTFGQKSLVPAYDPYAILNGRPVSVT